MATIKAGTYVLSGALNFSMLTSNNTIQYNGNNITIGDVVFDGGVYFSIHINKNGTITHNDVSWVEGMNGAGAITYTFYNGSWTDEKYRTWVFAGDYEVDDETATWFNSNLYAPEAKLIRLYREDEIAWGLPIELSTETDMDAALAGSTSADIGKVYKYIGETTDTYIQNKFYVIEAE